MHSFRFSSLCFFLLFRLYLLLFLSLLFIKRRQLYVIYWNIIFHGGGGGGGNLVVLFFHSFKIFPYMTAYWTYRLDEDQKHVHTRYTRCTLDETQCTVIKITVMWKGINFKMFGSYARKSVIWFYDLFVQGFSKLFCFPSNCMKFNNLNVPSTSLFKYKTEIWLTGWQQCWILCVAYVLFIFKIIPFCIPRFFLINVTYR